MIGNTLGIRLLHDVRNAIVECPPGYEPGDYDRGARAFFGWLVSSPADPARSLVLEAYGSVCRTHDGPAVLNVAALFATNASFGLFCNDLPAFASISGSTVWNRQRCAAHVLEGLGAVGCGRYPAFLTALHSRPRSPGETPMLGSLPIANGISTPSGVLRERQALDLVGSLALEEFRDHVIMVDAATPIRINVPSPGNAWAARECVHGALARAWSTLPFRPADRIRYASELVCDSPEMVDDPATWISAGIPERCVRRFSPDGARMRRVMVGRLALACLGPSPTMVLAGATVVARGRGWNKGSILEIPAQPYLFAIEGRFGVAAGSFVAALKARAGHSVAMFLSDRGHADGGILEELIREWRSAAEGLGADPSGDQMLLGGDPDDAPGAAVLEVFEALMRISKPLRLHDGRYGSMDRLFAFPMLNEGDQKFADRNLRLAASTTPALATGGATLPAIRASFFFVEHDHRRSLAATMAVTGQVTPAVAMRNYLNRKEVGAELRRALRFFQEICQTLMLRDKIVALEIGVGGADLDRLARLARASGMAAAFGLDVPQVGPAPVLRFTPSDANLRDLFLALWALRVASRTLPFATWRARCLEPFAAARAIAAALREAGLGTDYAAAARGAYADHRSGRVALPQVEGT